MQEQKSTPANMTPRDWVQILAKYREPSSVRSIFELAVSLIPFIVLWVLASMYLKCLWLIAGTGPNPELGSVRSG